MRVYNQQSGGEGCIQCCPVEIACDCTLLECLHLFATFALNKNADVYTGRLSEEVVAAVENLIGIGFLGTIERRVDSDDNAVVDFGRSYIQSLIENWAVQESFYRTRLQEIYRVLHPFWEDFKLTCGCDEENENRVDCQSLDCLMTAIFEFINIGIEQRPPFTLKEWAQGGLCGVCYQDCEGDDYIFEL